MRDERTIKLLCAMEAELIKTTIKGLFGLKGLNNRVYVIYDDCEPVYVGMANNQCVATRLAMHIKDVFDANKKNSSQLSTIDNFYRNI